MAKVLDWVDKNSDRLSSFGLAIIAGSMSLALACVCGVGSYGLILWAVHGFPK